MGPRDGETTFYPDDHTEPEHPLTPLQQVEQEHGFTFGGGPNPGTGSAALMCRNPHCDRTGQHVTINTDTAEPITCGGLLTDPTTGHQHPCGNVLQCAHIEDTTDTYEGTIGAPVKITTRTCLKCGTVLTTTREPLPPIDLTTLPANILNQPLQGNGIS